MLLRGPSLEWSVQRGTSTESRVCMFHAIALVSSHSNIKCYYVSYMYQEGYKVIGLKYFTGGYNRGVLIYTINFHHSTCCTTCMHKL